MCNQVEDYEDIYFTSVNIFLLVDWRLVPTICCAAGSLAKHYLWGFCGFKATEDWGRKRRGEKSYFYVCPLYSIISVVIPLNMKTLLQATGLLTTSPLLQHVLKLIAFSAGTYYKPMAFLVFCQVDDFNANICSILRHLIFLATSTVTILCINLPFDKASKT